MKYLIIALMALPLHSELLDKLAITVGRQVITDLQLDEEIRVTDFLNKQPVVRDIGARRAAADRLVQQLLIKREMDMSRYPSPTNEDVDKYLAGVISQFGGEEAFSAALKSYELTTDTIKAHLALQLTTMRFIEYRFRPVVDVSNSEIENAYQRVIQNWSASHSTRPPPLSEVRTSIVKALSSERVDYALNEWLEEARKRVDIHYIDKSLE
ncbi:MAG TPA: hypothetical protein VHZ07_11245 [Bryobacteraceae bacterium]|jgi:hypothetical protein|nr:hypothetical protein [Bryobacteraceae bacterium]